MKYTFVVHSDGEPFINIEQFKDHSELIHMISRTHNSLLDHGHALIDTKEDNDQRVMTYRYVKGDDDTRGDVYLVVCHE